MNVDRKYFRLFAIFFIGISCVAFSIYEFFSSQNTIYKENDFIQIKSRKCSSIKYSHHAKQTSIISFKLCSFPSVSFTSSNRVLTEDRIDDIQRQIGDTLYCSILKLDYYNFFTKSKKQNIFESSTIDIYSLHDQFQTYLTLNIDKLNNEINTNKMLVFYFFGAIGIIIVFYGFRKFGEI